MPAAQIGMRANDVSDEAAVMHPAAACEGKVRRRDGRGSMELAACCAELEALRRVIMFEASAQQVVVDVFEQ